MIGYGRAIPDSLAKAAAP